MSEKHVIKGYKLDNEGYYVTEELFRGRVWLKQCSQCKDYLYFIYAEKYSYFKTADILIAVGIKIYGCECDTCNCGFLDDGFGLLYPSP